MSKLRFQDLTPMEQKVAKIIHDTKFYEITVPNGIGIEWINVEIDNGLLARAICEEIGKEKDGR